MPDVERKLRVHHPPMINITSADGTTIALDRSGSGPPLVIVLGAFCDRSTSKPLAALLAPAFTVVEYDRRGRGASGDGNGRPDPIESEVEDLEAVISAAGEPAFVYGHSSGALLALEAAARGVGMRRLAVYEPPYTGEYHPGDAFGERLDELVAAGRRDEAAEAWMAMTGTPRPVIESIKAGPDWGHRQALAHTLSRDLRLANGGQVPTERLSRIDVPVLAMAGGASPPWALATTATVTAVLPRGVERVVDGQQHVPADEAIAPILAAFFDVS
jgi:pimeloyl-ACP methyl ester carboxylesterase